MSKPMPGHALIREGAPHDDEGKPTTSWAYSARTGGAGRAKCQCGTLSEILDSANKRKQWHRDHKNQILGDQVLEEIKDAGSFEEWRDQQR